MKRKASALVIVNTTVTTRVEAKKLADAVLESRLAACVQFTPIHSVYRWKGKLESTPEYLVLAKTCASLATDLMAFIKRRHPYEVPEILAAPVSAAYGKYQEWIEKETRSISHRTHRSLSRKQ